MSAFVLKWIAMITMIIDHAAATLGIFDYESYYLLRSVGRIAFPIYVFFIAEGCLKTKNLQKYFVRLSLFAVISELPFDLLFANYSPSLSNRFSVLEFEHQNVFFTLALGVFAVLLFEKAKQLCRGFSLFDKTKIKLLPLAAANILIFLLAARYILRFADFFKTDYDSRGVLIIFCIYFIGKHAADIYRLIVRLLICITNSSKNYADYKLNFTAVKSLQIIAVTIFITLMYNESIIRFHGMELRLLMLVGFLAPVLLLLYNGKRGYRSVITQWMFYVIYPLHIMVLFIICACMYGIPGSS